MEENNEEKVYLNLKKVPLESEKQEKKKKRKFVFINFSIVVLLLVTGFVSGFFVYSKLHPTTSVDPNNTFAEIAAVLDGNYLYSNDYEDFNTELMDKAFYGMTDFEDDPYTTYMSKSEIDEFVSSINLNYVGIGVVYSKQNDFGVIERVILNSPAEKAGLLAGDIITAVDDQSIADLDTSEIKELVLGEEGTDIKISITRDGQAMDINVTRGNVDNSAYAYVENNYVYLEIYSFGENTASECMSYLDQYTDYDKIIIDIRSNTGGYQDSVEEVAGLFVGSNQVYLIKVDGDGNQTPAYTRCSKTYDNFKKIVILVDQKTASASEVFTLCLKEHLDDVTIVGTTTYGKGVMQSTHYLANGGALKFTSYQWLSSEGVSINGVGITPDIEVKLDDIYYTEYVKMKEDEVYEYDSISDVNKVAELALRYLKYDIDRVDGYFDQSLADAVYQYKLDNDLEANSIIDKDTYDAILASAILQSYTGEDDLQYQKAVELMAD